MFLPRLAFSAFVVAIAIVAAACSPTVQMAAPEKPITINLNVKIEHEVRVKVDKEVNKMFAENKGLF